MKLRSIVGQIPDPEELIGREEIIEHLWRQIETSNILLLSPRRFGKSGIMRHVLLKPRAGYLPLSFELEDVDSPEEFVWRITRELLANDTTRSLLTKVRNLPSAITGFIKDTFDEAGFEGAKVKFRESIKEDWREAARRMLLEMEKASPTIIFIFDEFPSMIEKIVKKQDEKTAVDVLAWFRTIRLQQKDTLRRHRYIVGGSIGIDVILRLMKSSDKLNDFCRIYVGPLDEANAKSLMSGLAETFGIAWNDFLGKRLLELLGPPVPFFIHLFFSQLGQAPITQRQAPISELLDKIYRDKILGTAVKSYFDHYSSRLERMGATRKKAAITILSSVAGSTLGRLSIPVLYDIYRKAHGRGAGKIDFDELMADLQYDWYLVLDPDTNEYYFMLNVMRDWWRRWYPMTAAAKHKSSR
ncbi:MAG: hypothetical protein NTX50_29635 [Candidatus Sumerlaeota bacterium]|nr:hypothetical protein [Candidatus Sumerlaeota bacterium]